MTLQGYEQVGVVILNLQLSLATSFNVTAAFLIRSKYDIDNEIFINFLTNELNMCSLSLV
jgi:hypothetical protein